MALRGMGLVKAAVKVAQRESGSSSMMDSQQINCRV
jgi:hypothetical protein